MGAEAVKEVAVVAMVGAAALARAAETDSGRRRPVRHSCGRMSRGRTRSACNGGSIRPGGTSLHRRCTCRSHRGMVPRVTTFLHAHGRKTHRHDRTRACIVPCHSCCNHRRTARGCCAASSHAMTQACHARARFGKRCETWCELRGSRKEFSTFLMRGLFAVPAFI